MLVLNIRVDYRLGAQSISHRILIFKHKSMVKYFSYT